MSLVDKLEGVHVGDLILIKKDDTARVGYILEYSTNSITLSNTTTVENGVIIDRRGFFNAVFLDGPRWKEKIVTLPLDHFDTYEILRKCSTDNDILSNEKPLGRKD